MENFPRWHRARLAARNLLMEFPGKQWKVHLQLSYTTLQKSHLPCHDSKKNTGPERTREASSSCNVYPARSNIKLTLYQLTNEMYSRVHLQEHKAGQRRGNWQLFNLVQLLSHVRLFEIPWTAACQASLFITKSWSMFNLMSIKLIMPSHRLILCCPLLLPPSIFPSIRVFSD